MNDPQKIKQVDPIECKECKGTGKEYFSDCCGAKLFTFSVIAYNGEMFRCTDCQKNCGRDWDKCPHCIYGLIYPTDSINDIIENEQNGN